MGNKDPLLETQAGRRSGRPPASGTEPPERDAYRDVFHASPDYISLSRVSDGRFIDVNAGFEQFTGYSRAEVVGRCSSDINLWPSAEERQRFVQAVTKDGHCREFCCQLRTRSGELRSAEIAARLKQIDGEMVLVSVVRDVTERQRAEEELRRYRAELEQLVAQRTEALSRAHADLERAHAQLKRTHSRLQLSEQQSRHRAHHDLLTGLPNRLLLLDRIGRAVARAKRTKEPLALLFVDLDDFKQVNDTQGHAAGDQLLRTVATRLQACVRSSDTVCRLGGDEFVLLITGLTAEEDAAAVAQKVLASVCRPVDTPDGQAQVSASIGISIWPRDGTGVEELMAAADAAMYRAKSGGKHNYCFDSVRA